MTPQDLPEKKIDGKAQANEMRPAPVLRRANIRAGKQELYPERLQYTGKNLRVDYLTPGGTESASGKAGGGTGNNNIRKTGSGTRNINAQHFSTQARPVNSGSGVNSKASAQFIKPPVNLAAENKTELAIAKAREQALRSQQRTVQERTAAKVVANKKPKRILPIVAGIILVSLAIVFLVNSFFKQDPVIPNNPSESTAPVQEKAWTDEEYQRAKLALAEDIFFPGIFIADVDMSGLSAEEGSEALSGAAERLRAEINITVKANNESFTLSADDLAYSYDTFSALEKAWSIGRSSEHYDDELDLILRYQVISTIEKETLHIDLDGDFDETVAEYSLQQKLADVLPVFSEAKATGFDTSRLRFQVEEGTVGLQADISAAIKDIHQLIRKNELQGEVVLVLEEKHPEMTGSMILNNTGLIAQASTPIYGSWQADRNYNLFVAAEKMTGAVVQPGETYSYLTSLGPITTQAGFMSGSAIVGGTYVDVIGGGLCQPSTTLFQAVVKADLEIVERHNHGMRSDYYYYGQDAMIYGGSFDFKFRNNTDYPVAMVAETSGSYLVYKIYGKPLADGVTIELLSVKTGDLAPITTTKEVLNTEIKPGESKQVLAPIVGSTWETYKVYYKNGVEFDRQYLTYSRYPSVARRIEFGPSVAPTESVTETLLPETTKPPTEATTKAATEETTIAPTEATTELPTETQMNDP